MELKSKANDRKAKKGQEGKDGEEEEVDYKVHFKQQDYEPTEYCKGDSIQIHGGNIKQEFI